jgi:signal peptidase I
MSKFISKNKKNKSKNKESVFSKFKKSINDSPLGVVISKLKWLDPFTYVDLFIMPKVKAVTDSELVETGVNIIFAGLFALIVYLLLGALFGTAQPLVIVYSASMEPVMYRGDVMALTKANSEMDFGGEVTINQNLKNMPINNFLTAEYENNNLSKLVFENKEIIPNQNGSIIVYNSYPQGLPIIHRSIVKIKALDGEFVLTKGDNALTNYTYDQDCGKIDQLRNTSTKNCVSFYAVPIEKIEGVAFFGIPKIGCIKLWLFDDLISIIGNGSLPRDFRGIC